MREAAPNIFKLKFLFFSHLVIFLVKKVKIALVLRSKEDSAKFVAVMPGKNFAAEWA